MLELLRERYPIGLELEPAMLRVSRRLISTFAECIQDFNPLHLDEEYAKGTYFKQQIAHGMLSACLISAVFGKIDGAVFVNEESSFLAPVYPGDTIRAYAQVIGYHPHKAGRVLFVTSCRKNQGELVLSGEATIWFPNLLTETQKGGI